MHKTTQVIKSEKEEPTKKIKELEVRFECINKKLFSAENWRDILKREYQINEEILLTNLKEVLGLRRN